MCQVCHQKRGFMFTFPFLPRLFGPTVNFEDVSYGVFFFWTGAFLSSSFKWSEAVASSSVWGSSALVRVTDNTLHHMFCSRSRPAEFVDRFRSSLGGRRLTEPVRLVTFVETAVGLLNFKGVCEEIRRLAPQAGLLHDGVVFGSDDFCASIGATRTEGAGELLYARQKVVVTSKAFGLQAIDLVHIDYKDLGGLRRQAREGALMGFTGKQVIHPGQVQVVQEEFSPHPQRVQWATELIAAFEQHQKEGKGAFTFRGVMIDLPALKQAQNIISLSVAVTQTQLEEESSRG
ncbi:citramalyl-CoA lyase, mitochondrial isoform X4 [Antennarius striatus]|uniref:citramalyl-CoA lyase, mitochondrial isoform X4 n=1 Tax=Antennarius striatus TaxID=241820 RepID=UPI0035AFF9DA